MLKIELDKLTKQIELLEKKKVEKFLISNHFDRILVLFFNILYLFRL